MGGEQQDAFEEIKHILIRPPILRMPKGQGRFHLYLDMSKFAMGSSLYQIQNGQQKLIANASKRFPEAARNYSITELRVMWLSNPLRQFFTLIKEGRFQCNSATLSLEPYH